MNLGTNAVHLLGIGCETVAFAAVFGQVTPSAEMPAWMQGGAVGLLVLVLGWVGKILLPGKDALLQRKDETYKALLDAKDAQLEKKDQTLLAILTAKSAEREKSDDRFVNALSMVGDKFQAAMLRFEQDHDKRDAAWEARVEKLVDSFMNDGKESRDHQRREWEAHAALCKVERDQRERDHADMRARLERIEEKVVGHENPGH